MENQLTIFKNPAFGEVRVIRDENNSPWFVGKDVAAILGYAKPENAIATHVDEDDKTSTLIQGTGSNYKSKSIIINESGLYALILSSKLPQAKQFKHWVTSEVLPSIRKNGSYLPIRNEDDLIAYGYAAVVKRIDKLESENKALELKADHLDNVILCNQCYTMTQVAKDLGMTVHQLTDYLLERHIIFHQSRQYMLYADYACLGLAKNRTGEKTMEDGTIKVFAPQLVWTEKGRKFIHNLVKANPPRVNQKIALLLTQPSLFPIS